MHGRWAEEAHGASPTSSVVTKETRLLVLVKRVIKTMLWSVLVVPTSTSSSQVVRLCLKLSEEEQKGASKALIVRDLRSKAPIAHAVEKMGLDEKGYTVDAVVADMCWTGCLKVLIKSDNETAMLRVLARARKQLKDERLEIVLDAN